MSEAGPTGCVPRCGEVGAAARGATSAEEDTRMASFKERAVRPHFLTQISYMLVASGVGEARRRFDLDELLR